MRAVFVTQHVDPAHPALAATVPKVRALAARVDEVVVLAAGRCPSVLPATAACAELRGRTRLGRGLRFAAGARRGAGRRPSPGAVVAHMCPLYAVLAGPLARPRRVPRRALVHALEAVATLLLAERSSTAIAQRRPPRSFPLASRKVRAIGHGIDLGGSAASNGAGHPDLRAVALGRYSRAKGSRRLRAVRLALDDGSTSGSSCAGRR